MAVAYLDLAPNGRIFSVSDLPDSDLLRVLRDSPVTTKHPRRLRAVPTPPGVPWGHWGGVGRVGAPQEAHIGLFVQINREMSG